MKPRYLSYDPGGMDRLLRPTMTITFFLLVGQAVAFVTQVVTASLFGAGADMDAYLAANTLPQYAITVLLGSLSSVFIPVFVDYIANGRDSEAWKIASSIINLCLLALGFLSAIGILFAEPILQATTPGLPYESLSLGSKIAMITWPTIVATGVLSILSGMYQVFGRFGWQAAVPVIGASVNLTLVFVLARWFGVIGLALAATCSAIFQVALLLGIAMGRGRYELAISWRHPGVQQVIRLLLPLIISGLFIRITPLVERYWASSLAVGSISHLSYAFRPVGMLAGLVSGGIATVVFPRMAFNLAGDDTTSFKHTVSLSLRMMWLVVAPIIVTGYSLSLPLLTAVFQRGRFTAADVESVNCLFQVYLLALVGLCFGNITGRGLYALKMTRTVAVVGIIESLAYVGYAVLLVQQFGVVGLVWGYVLYFDLSLLWQAIVIWYKIGGKAGRTVISSFVRTAIAAVLGGGAAWSICAIWQNLWIQLLFGGTLSLLIYVIALQRLGSVEARTILGILVRRLNIGTA
jgi:putative peptidoglycan lipid II flippase